MIRQRGAAVGFEFSAEGRPRVYNTFNAHRLLHWAELESPAKQAALKKLLLKAYFTDSQNPSDPDVLVRAATEAGLDATRPARSWRATSTPPKPASASACTPTPASTRCPRSSSTTST
jgi:predicted DsbA family dithiol-disulfide isomerase